jgi:hypothetical protein
VILDRTLSVSFIAALGEADKALVRNAVEILIATHPQLAGKARVTFPYRTEAY